jgi:hypothetical protein
MFPKNQKIKRYGNLLITERAEKALKKMVRNHLNSLDKAIIGNIVNSIEKTLKEKENDTTGTME